MSTQRDGWPEGVSDGEKVMITSAVKEILGGEGNALCTSDLARRVRDMTGWRCPLLDTQYAAIERACRALGAEHRWSLGA